MSTVGIVGTVVGLVEDLPLGLLIAALSTILVAAIFMSGLAPVESVLGVLPGMRRTDPREIRRAYFLELVEAAREASTRFADEDRLTSKFSSNQDEKLAATATLLSTRASMHWGRAALRRQFKAAWLYAAAGTVYEMAHRGQQAADAYHYAANAFRWVGSLERALEYYLRSADVLKSVRGEEALAWRRRCLQRALGVARVMGDLYREDELASEVRALGPGR